MLDKVIHAHIDKMEEIENDMADSIDAMINSVNIDEIMDNPSIEMDILAEEIGNLIEEKYAPNAIENGLNFAQKVNDLNRDIKVQDSNNPTLNQDQFDDKRTD